MPVYKQTNLSGGILRQGLWGRTDLKRYDTFVRRSENIYVTPTGQLTNRPGTTYQAGTKGNVEARLIPFIFSDGQAYVLEFTPLAIRIMQAGAFIKNTGVDVVVVTPFTAADLENIKYAQCADEMFIACSGYTPKVLSRVAQTNWTLADVSFNRTVSAPTGLAWAGGYTPDQTGDATHIPKEWQWKVTAWSADGFEESAPSTAFGPAGNGKVALSEDKPAVIQWTAVAGASRYSVYRGRNGVFGYIGDAIGQVLFRDDGQTPVISESPPINRNPFNTPNLYPQVVAFHQQRLAFANLPVEPEWTYLSQGGAFRNFDYQEPAKEDDSLDFGVASRTYEEIRNLISVDNNLLVLTSGVEWVVTASDGGPLIAPDAPLLRPQSYWGSSWLDALVIGDEVVFQVDGGYPIRSMKMGDNSVWQSRDLSVYAGLADDTPIVGWCYQRRPHRLIWGHDEWGNLYTTTFDSETDTYAWAKHYMTNGRVVSICSIPEGIEDSVYMVVARADPLNSNTVNYYIERMVGRQDYYPALNDNLFLDCATSFDGRNTDPNNRLTISKAGGGAIAVGDTVTIVSSTAGTFTAQDVSDYIVLHPGDMKHRIVIQVTGYTNGTTVVGMVRAESNLTPDAKWPLNTQAIQGWVGALPPIRPWTRQPGDVTSTIYPMSRSDWGWASSTFTLGSVYDVCAQVVAKADGAVVTPTRAGGTFTLASPAVFVTFGVPYRQVVDALDLVPTSPSGQDLTLNNRIIRKAAFEVVNTSPGFLVGEDPDGTLSPWQPEAGAANTADFGPGTEDLTYTGLVFSPIFSGWNRGGRICLVNTNPFPLTITALVREVEFGGT